MPFLLKSKPITLSPDKIPIENGIEPDIPVTISSLQDATGIDPILEKAYQLCPKNEWT